MPSLISKSFLKTFNPFLDLSFDSISINSCGHHAVATLPANVLTMTISDNGKGTDYYENLVENYKMPIRANNIYFIPCGLKMRFEESCEHQVLSMHFNVTFFHGLDIFAGCTHSESRNDPELVGKFHGIFNRKEDLKSIFELKMEVMRLCLDYWPENAGMVTVSMLKYEPVFRHIRQHVNAELRVRDLAKIMGWRENVFSRNFTRDIGKSPKDILSAELLKKVSAKLLQPNASVREVANELKFCSEFYMSRFFKRHTGISPSGYQANFQ